MGAQLAESQKEAFELRQQLDSARAEQKAAVSRLEAAAAAHAELALIAALPQVPPDLRNRLSVLYIAAAGLNRPTSSNASGALSATASINNLPSPAQASPRIMGNDIMGNAGISGGGIPSANSSPAHSAQPSPTIAYQYLALPDCNTMSRSRMAGNGGVGGFTSPVRGAGGVGYSSNSLAYSRTLGRANGNGNGKSNSGDGGASNRGGVRTAFSASGTLENVYGGVNGISGNLGIVSLNIGKQGNGKQGNG
ncbi:hypothetical protein Agub_g3727, partial [Astrephomene gubernaculifera]